MHVLCIIRVCTCNACTVYIPIVCVSLKVHVCSMHQFPADTGSFFMRGIDETDVYGQMLL